MRSGGGNRLDSFDDEAGFRLLLFRRFAAYLWFKTAGKLRGVRSFRNVEIAFFLLIKMMDKVKYR